jgi:hypothetical protein
LAFTTAAESDCAKAVLKMKTAKKEKINFKFERHSSCFIMMSKSKLKKEFGKCNIIRWNSLRCKFIHEGSFAGRERLFSAHSSPVESFSFQVTPELTG